MYNDLQVIAPEQYFKHVNKRLAEIHAVSSPEDRSVLIQVLESVYRFALGSIAGGKINPRVFALFNFMNAIIFIFEEHVSGIKPSTIPVFFSLILSFKII